MYSYFKIETDVAQILIDFFVIFTVREPFHRKDFKWKKYGGMELISEKTKVLLAEEWKYPPVVTPQQMIFYNVFILCLWLRIIKSSNKGV